MARLSSCPEERSMCIHEEDRRRQPVLSFTLDQNGRWRGGGGGGGEGSLTLVNPSCPPCTLVLSCCFSVFRLTNDSIHEVVSHLGNTHIVLEGVLVAMHRQLPKEHPLYDLIHPHLEGTAFINYHAQDVSRILGEQPNSEHPPFDTVAPPTVTSATVTIPTAKTPLFKPETSPCGNELPTMSVSVSSLGMLVATYGN